MAKEITKILGQLQPAAINTEETVYIVAKGRQAVNSSIVFTNQDAGPVTFKIAIVPDGTSTTTVPKHYIRFNKSIAAAGNDDIKLGITLDEFDQIRVEANNTNCSFNVFGVELGQEE